MAKEKGNPSEVLKVLRVGEKAHQTAKVMSAQRGEKLQTYVEHLIKADEQGLIDWEKITS